METRFLIAYALISILVVGGGVIALLTSRRRAARRRRLRGIKDYDGGAVRTSTRR